MNGTPAPSYQDLGHPEGFDYEAGSPHLRHSELQRWIVTTIQDVIGEQFASGRVPRVLEVGAGHGTFTDHILATGAAATVTEMSSASAALLQQRYAHNPQATVLFDETGDGAELSGQSFDVVIATSVLHHIPDYVAAIDRWVHLLRPGGAFLSFQDPLWYPRRSRASMIADRGAFMIWRLGRGNLLEGAQSVLRRARHAYDETKPNDMVEYHVVRQGCDEQQIVSRLTPEFDRVSVSAYWSTQARPLQRLGTRAGLVSSFAVQAVGKL